MADLTRETVGVTEAAVSRAFRKLPPGTFDYIRKTVFDTGRLGGRVFALDGSVVKLPPALRQQGFQEYHRRPVMADRASANPIALLSALVDVNTREIVDFRWSEKRNERTHADELFLSAKPGDIVIMDRGYFSKHLLRLADALGIRVLFRMAKRACVEVVKFLQRPRRQMSIREAEVDRVRCRLVHFRACGSAFTCLTTARMTAREVADAYRKRWAVETWFRSMKSDLHVKRFRTTSSAVFLHLLEAAMLAYSLINAHAVHRSSKRASPREGERRKRPVERSRTFARDRLAAALMFPWFESIVRESPTCHSGPGGGRTPSISEIFQLLLMTR